MENKFNKIEKEIFEILIKSPIVEELVHAKNVLKWVLKLSPGADEALRISAIAHDIERGVTGITEKDLKDYSKINEFKEDHAKRSAKIIVEIMQKYEYEKQIINKVYELVKNHEVGGDGDVEILKNADSLAYFEYNVPFYFKRNGEDQTINKIKLMYDRMSGNAKDLLKTINYEDENISNLVKRAIN